MQGIMLTSKFFSCNYASLYLNGTELNTQEVAAPPQA